MKKTKIICTMGPATADDEVLKEIMRSGMDVARINFSHGNGAEHLPKVEQIKRLREELGLPIALLLDTSGPEIRLGNFENDKIQLRWNSDIGNFDRFSGITTKTDKGDDE